MVFHSAAIGSIVSMQQYFKVRVLCNKKYKLYLVLIRLKTRTLGFERHLQYLANLYLKLEVMNTVVVSLYDKLIVQLP